MKTKIGIKKPIFIFQMKTILKLSKKPIKPHFVRAHFVFKTKNLETTRNRALVKNILFLLFSFNLSVSSPLLVGSCKVHPSRFLFFYKPKSQSILTGVHGVPIPITKKFIPAIITLFYRIITSSPILIT